MQELFNMDVAEMEPLEGPIEFAHQFVNMSEYRVEVDDPDNGRVTVRLLYSRSISLQARLFLVQVGLCKPALGYGFAGGTTDGPGAFTFTQGVTTSNEFWDMVSSALVPPSDQVKECHAPKPVLLSTGEVIVARLVFVLFHRFQVAQSLERQGKV